MVKFGQNDWSCSAHRRHLVLGLNCTGSKNKNTRTSSELTKQILKTRFRSWKLVHLISRVFPREQNIVELYFTYASFSKNMKSHILYRHQDRFFPLRAGSQQTHPIGRLLSGRGRSRTGVTFKDEAQLKKSCTSFCRTWQEIHIFSCKRRKAFPIALEVVCFPR